MSYRLIFDAARSGYTNWPFAAGGLVFVCIGVLLVKGRAQAPKKALRYVFLGFSILWTIIAFVGTGHDYTKIRKALANGSADIVEGRVEDFVPMPHQGHALEHFSVCGVPFAYSDYVVTAGFNHTSSHGGPIRPGLWVRITHVGNTIGRLEVATTDPGPEAQCRRMSP